jgi:hypothetical protein
LAGKDELLRHLLPVLDRLNDKALHYLLKHIEVETYQQLQGEVIQVLQAYPGMTSQPEGVVSGDDTLEFKEGVKMPGIQVLFKASEGRYHLGYCIVSTHYADDQKDYPLLFDIRRRSEGEVQAAAAKKEQKSLGLDLRKPADYLQWVAHQVAGQKPALAVLSDPVSIPKSSRQWTHEALVRAVPQSGYEDEQVAHAKSLRLHERAGLSAIADCGQQVLVKTGNEG